LDVQVEAASTCPSSTEQEDILVIDLDSFRNLVFPLPNDAWRRIVDCGRTLPPVYRTLQSALSNDFANVVRVLSDVEPSWDCDVFDEVADDFDDPCPMNLGSSYVEPEPYVPLQPHIHRKRWRRSLSTDEYYRKTSNSRSSVPTIVVTPCEPQKPEISCRVPLQNCAFGSRLTVPRHPVFNQVFPPLSPSPHTLFANKRWRWQDGHWQATLPSLEEQAQKGLFSRALVVRRRSRRRR